MLNADRFGAVSRNVLPVPIPPNPNLGGLHLQLPFVPGQGDESATVYDFNGLIGRAHAQNVGTGNGVTVFGDADLDLHKARSVPPMAASSRVRSRSSDSISTRTRRVRLKFTITVPVTVELQDTRPASFGPFRCPEMRFNTAAIR